MAVSGEAIGLVRRGVLTPAQILCSVAGCMDGVGRPDDGSGSRGVIWEDFLARRWPVFRCSELWLVA